MEQLNDFLHELTGNFLQRITGEDSHLLTKVGVTLIILLIMWLLRRLAVKAIGRFYDSRKNATAFYHWKNGVNYAIYIVGILIIGQTWFSNFQSVATYLGLVSAGLAVALQDPIMNFAGWLFIIWRKPFEVGDRVQIEEISGDVIDLRVFEFTVIETGNWVDADQTTGRIIHIPNSKVFKEPLANYTTGFKYIWNEIGVLVTFESDWRKAKNILHSIVCEHAEEVTDNAEREIRRAAMKYLINVHLLSPTVYTNVKDSGVMLTMRYMCDSRQRRVSTMQVWEKVLDAFAKTDNIDLAYPTYRVYSNVREGKSGLKPE